MPPKKKIKLVNQGKITSFTSFSFTSKESNVEQGEIEQVAKSSECTIIHGKETRQFQHKWLKIWPWVKYEKEKMYCKMCIEHEKVNSFTTGCSTMKTSSLSRHEATVDHKSCYKENKLALHMTVAVEKANSERDIAVIKAMKIVHWFAKENVALSKYESLMTLLHDLAVPGLHCLKVSDRIAYESYYSAKELLDAMSHVVNNDINKHLARSPVVTLLSDESTDISNTKRMTITATVVDPETSSPSTLFLRDTDYVDGTGEGLASVIIKEISQRNIPFEKVMGFGSDGAAVMSSPGRGVFGRLKEHNPHMIHIHCIAHRLALCTSQAAKSIPDMKQYAEWMTQLFYYFKASPTRESQLKHVEKLLEHPTLKYKEVHEVRWMSFFEAVEVIYRTLDPLMTFLASRESTKDPKAKGLLKFMAQTKFFFITYMMMDVMPIISKLVLTFQKENLDVAKAKISLDACINDLSAYKDGTYSLRTKLSDFSQDTADNKYQEHILVQSQRNLASLKSQFLNKLIENINARFPQRSLLDSFFVLSMRTMQFERDVEAYGLNEIEHLLSFYGEEKTHGLRTSSPVLSKIKVREQWHAAKNIVMSGKYPVDNMINLWSLLTRYHNDELEEIIKLAQIALSLPLHTAGCERVFSQQNLIVTRLRSRLSPDNCEKLLRLKLKSDDFNESDYERCLQQWRQKNRRLQP